VPLHFRIALRSRTDGRGRQEVQGGAGTVFRMENGMENPHFSFRKYQIFQPVEGAVTDGGEIL